MKTISLTQGKFALVDDSDYELLAQFQWCAMKGTNTWYAVRTSRSLRGTKRTILMHRSILGDIPELDIDHINGDGLDNRRSNLRWTTRRQNQANRRAQRGTSRYKGVYWDRTKQRWRSGIQIDGKYRHIGTYRHEEEAARAYDQVAHSIFGAYARLNFPETF